jgi:glycosyltransferase involved in cell wall biosynthesis
MIQPFISVIIPTRNESKYIESALTSILNQDYPTNLMEVIIADGLSNDATLDRINRFKIRHPDFEIAVIENEKKIVPTGLNKAIGQSKGEVIVRLDAHSVYPMDYISKLVAGLFEHNAHNTGGIVKTLPAGQSNKCKSIAIALSHPLGVGNSHFRIGSPKVRDVDTVPFGCFRREVFDVVGLFDEELVRNQDDEFNGRLIKAGYRIVLIPDVVIEYYARDEFSKLYKMYYQYGLYKPLASYKLGGVTTIRQLIPLGFVLSLFLGAILATIFQPFIWVLLVGLLFYFGILGVVSFKQSYHNKSLLFFHLIASFFILHFSYGLGYLVGVIALFTGRKKVFKQNALNR